MKSLFIFLQSTSLLWALLSCRSMAGDATVVKTITVDQSGHGDYKFIQEAINSVPDYNQLWIKIHVRPGIYNEKVVINYTKEFIFLEGESPRKTVIQWGDHVDAEPHGSGSIGTADTATFTVWTNNFVARNITFRNTYNSLGDKPQSQAVAALVSGDKIAFYRCGFIGLQDTLFDHRGRHYFRGCWIVGSVDFIFGRGRSIYEKCHIIVVGRPDLPGYITAHGRDTPDDTSAFVFKHGTITGTGKAYLGRAWRPYSTVLFYRTNMSDAIVPQGWDAWNAMGKEYQTTYAEINCRGPGANTSNRVNWEKRLPHDVTNAYISNDFIDWEGWRSQQPK